MATLEATAMSLNTQKPSPLEREQAGMAGMRAGGHRSSTTLQHHSYQGGLGDNAPETHPPLPTQETQRRGVTFSGGAGRAKMSPRRVSCCRPAGAPARRARLGTFACPHPPVPEGVVRAPRDVARNAAPLQPGDPGHHR
jgi:hypothetical protein